MQIKSRARIVGIKIILIRLWEKIVINFMRKDLTFELNFFRLRKSQDYLSNDIKVYRLADRLVSIILTQSSICEE